MSAKGKYPLRGPVVSLNTPFDDNDDIDFASLERAVQMHLDEGAAGFLASARAGEVYALRLEERIAILRALRIETRGRAELIAGATARAERDRRAVAEAAVGLGCEGVLIEIPPELGRDADRIVRFIRDFAAVGMPMLMIQDLAWEGWGMDVALIRRLFEEIEPFRCLKVETAPAGPKYTAAIEATGGRLHVSGGWAVEQMLEALDRGVDVFMNTAMTRWYKQIMDAHDRGDRRAAAECFHKVLPVLAFTHQHLDISIQFYKRLFEHRGIFRTTRVRGCALSYDSFHERCGRELIDYLDRLESPS